MQRGARAPHLLLQLGLAGGALDVVNGVRRGLVTGSLARRRLSLWLATETRARSLIPTPAGKPFRRAATAPMPTSSP